MRYFSEPLSPGGNTLSFDRTSRARWLCAPGILVGALVVAGHLYSTALVAQETPAPTAAHRAVHPDTVLRGDALQIAAAVRAVFAAPSRQPSTETGQLQYVKSCSH